MNQSPFTSEALEAFEKDLTHRLESLKSRSLHRRLQTAGSSLVDFTSNDYLGVNSTGKIHEIYRSAIQVYRGSIGSTGSRLLSGHTPEFSRAEKQLSLFTGHEDCLLFNSGYAANTGAISALLHPGDLALCDRLIHASILDGVRLSGANKRFFAHNDLDDLEEKLQKLSGKTKGRIWILVETLYSLDGDSPDLVGLVNLAGAYGALVYADEAHAIGVLGPEGQGLVASHGLQRQIAVTVYPMGKAPGLMGGFVAGSSVIKEYLVNHSRSLIYSTAMPPLLPLMLEKILVYLRGPHAGSMRRVLFELSSDLIQALRGEGFSVPDLHGPIIPLVLGDSDLAKRASQVCREHGFDVRAILPPSVPTGQSRLRLSIHSVHKKSDLMDLVEVLSAWKRGEKGRL